MQNSITCWLGKMGCLLGFHSWVEVEIPGRVSVSRHREMIKRCRRCNKSDKDP